MANKTLTAVRTDQPADTPSNNTIIWCEKGGNTRGFTLDEISLLLQGATVQQGLQDAHRGCLLRAGVGGHSAGAIDWDSFVYDTDSMWSGVSLTRITPPADATKIRLTASLHDMDGLTPDSSLVYMSRNGAAAPEIGLPAEQVNGRTHITLVSPVIQHTNGDYYELVKDSLGSFAATSWFACEIVEQVQSP